jgi:transcriptional regulator with XRE-family HTH domain
MNEFFLKQKTPKEISAGIAFRMRSLRKLMKLSQERLSGISGVSLGSVKRFERIGEISLVSLAKIAIALSCEDDFENLFSNKPLTSIQEVIDGDY